MAKNSYSDDEVRERLWEEIKGARFGMLGVVGSRDHFQPMTAFPDPEETTIWFFTRKDTTIARNAQDAATEAMFIIQSRDNDFQACIGGRLLQDANRERIDRYWNPLVAAWFPDGKDDAYLTLLKLEGRTAAVWIEDAGRARFSFEVAKANLTGKTPDLSEHHELPLGGGGLRA
ncbi:MAG TPA: pyridoxamine 5'-phosphate oxidase family protein [Caulobacteraceae bacterium]|jgi:general stress protein 26